MMTDMIRTRRAALVAQMETAQQQYDRLEQVLKTLDRQLCAMAGGLQELDALIAAEADTPAPTNGHALRSGALV